MKQRNLSNVSNSLNIDGSETQWHFVCYRDFCSYHIEFNNYLNDLLLICYMSGTELSTLFFMGLSKEFYFIY